jgi:hypothetical protein
MAEQDTRVLANGIKFVGETMVLPGSSLMLEGKIGSGLLHTVAAVAAGAVLGPIGALLVIANSYSKAVTDQNLWETGSRAIRSVGAAVRSTQSPSSSST